MLGVGRETLCRPDSWDRRPLTVTEKTLPNNASGTVAVGKDRKGRARDSRSVGSEQPATLQAEQQRDYADLKRLIVREGLLDKQLGFYALNVALSLSFLAASLVFLLVVGNFWLQLLNAAFLACVFGQWGFLGHDAGHRQIFNGAPRNDLFGLVPSLVLGLSRSWWIDTHNQHHVNPNDLDLDPHTALPILAFSEEQARSKRGFLRFLVGYQSFYFVPVLLLEGIGIRIASVQYLLRAEVRQRALEASLIVLHVALYLGLVFYALSVGQAVVFILVHQALYGLYFGSVFAPNHKGMPTLDSDSQLDFVRRQVLTSRDVKAHPLTDFWYGGLNYQIEHHLFPSMPRNKLKKAQTIVRAFCEERSIPYRETGALQSNREILQFLYEVSAPLREARA
jgi:fatty acid desaturase